MRTRRFFFFVIALVAFGMPLLASAQDASPAPTSLGELVGGFYISALQLVGLAVFLMFLYAGLSYLFNDGRTLVSGDPAWHVFRDAVIGTILLFSAYVILNSINPDLVGQQGRSVPRIQSN